MNLWTTAWNSSVRRYCRLFDVEWQVQPDFLPIDRHVCVFAEQPSNRLRRCFCCSCPLRIHTGHDLNRIRHWPVHVCPPVSVDRVHWSPVDWCWPAVQSVPPTTTDVTGNHIELVVCCCSLMMTECVGAVQRRFLPRMNDLLSPLNVCKT